MKKLKLQLGLVCFMFLMSGVIFANTYGVQCYKTPTLEEALQKQESLIQEGFAPVTIYRDGVMFKVVIGKYDDILTPKWIVASLQNSGDDLEIIKVDSINPISESLESASMNNGISNYVKFISLKNNGKNASSFNLERPEAKEFFNKFNNEPIEQAEIYLQNVLDSASIEDPVRGWAMLKNGYVQIRKKDKEAAKESFRALAEGRVECTKEHQCEAMMRLGNILAGQKKKLEAYQVYETWENFTDDPVQKAQALVQQAGIIMEIARTKAEDGGGGTLEDCREACLKVLDFVSPSEAPRTCATAELMFFETYYYGGDYEKTINLGLDFLYKYADQTRESSMAIQFVGLALNKVDDYEGAVDILMTTFDKDFSERDSSFGTDGKPWDMKQKAANWITYIAKKRKDYDRINQLAIDYPEYFEPCE